MDNFLYWIILLFRKKYIDFSEEKASLDIRRMLHEEKF